MSIRYQGTAKKALLSEKTCTEIQTTSTACEDVEYDVIDFCVDWIFAFYFKTVLNSFCDYNLIFRKNKK